MKRVVTAAIWTFITMAYSEEYKPIQFTQQIGKMTSIKDYPWISESLAFLYRSKIRICGGVSITNAHVLSVAACTRHIVTKKITVLFGKEYYSVARIYVSSNCSIELSILHLKDRIELGPVNRTISEPRIDYTAHAVRFIRAKKWEYQIEEGIIIKKTNIIEMNPVNDIKRIMVSVRRGAPLFQGKNLIGISGYVGYAAGYGYINVAMYLPFIRNVLSISGL